MSRLSLILFVAVLGSALYLVRTQYESRSLTTELDRAMSESRRLRNTRMKRELRLVLRYPTVREGLAAVRSR